MKKQLLFVIALLLGLNACQRLLVPTNTNAEQYRIEAEANLVEDTAIVNILAPYKVQLDAEMNEVLGQAGMELNKAQPESTLGNWMADVTQTQCEKYYGKPIDFAIVNYGGVRISQLPQGPISRGKIFELMPFDNMLVVLEVNGTVVHELFDRMADYGGWPISHSVKYKIVDGKAQDIRIHGLPLTLKKIYRIGLTDFVANGGDHCAFFIDQPRVALNVLFRDAILEYVVAETEAGRGIESVVEGRVMNE